MKQFNYKATDKKTGKTIKGVVQAESEFEAGKLLVEKKYAPIRIVERGTDGIFDSFKYKVKKKDQIVFTRQFSTLIGAGLPMANALRTILEQTDSPGMKAVIEDLLASVESGKSLEIACSRHPDVFDRLYLALVSAGEASGTLDQSLKRLAAQQEKDANMISKIRGAMVYPGIVFVVILFVMVFMLVEVVPQVENLYKDMGEELPGMTQILVGMADFIMGQWWIIILALIAAGVAIRRFLKTDAGKKVSAKFKLKMPMFSGLFHRLYNSRFARTAEVLMASGVPVLDTMTIAAESMSNTIMEKEIIDSEEKVKAGRPLSEALTGLPYILPLVPQMAGIGEQSGKMDEMMGRAATIYENELDEKIESISTMIEPVLMIAMAGVMVFLIGAVMMPIYSLVSQIG